MYESPLSRIYEEIQTKIIEHEENQILQAVQNCGITVDKEELLKALQYDRQQYEKGYADAKAEQRWIPCSEGLPEEGQHCLVCDGGVVALDIFIGHGNPYNWGWYVRDYEAWMPLPEPYRGEPCATE